MQRPGFDVFEFARRVDGLSGIELQVYYRGTSLADTATRTAYREAARTAGLLIPSIAGVWDKGESLMHPVKAEPALRRAIDVAQSLGARVILVAAFRNNCPAMDNPASFEPVVGLLKRVAPAASSAGVILALETSLSPPDDGKLVDLVNHPAVKVYFDGHNTEFYGHTGQSLSGITVLGSRIAQVHCKNEDRLLEADGPVKWAEVLPALRKSGYTGWITFETRHASPELCIADTVRNIAFARRRLGR
jgi:sugar phosphate isomerase/epimerase